MAYIYDIADTWNASGTTFTAIKMNVTDTASAAASLLMDLQVGGSSKFSVTKAGTTTFSGNLQVANNAVYIEGTAVGTIRVPGSNGYYGWTTNSASTSASTIDLFLARDAANTLAQRNGVNAQAFNLYNSYTDVSNYSRLVMYADGSANYYIGTQKAGTGSSASLFVGTGAGSGVAGNGALTLAGSTVQIKTQFGNVFNVNASGVMAWNSDNSNDIGLSTGDRPRSVYVATSITPGRGVAVASLPTPSTGMIARVTDALTPTIGTTVAGGGAAYALVNYNGTNWTVIGV